VHVVKRDPHVTPTARCYVTSRGIVIGRRYVPPPRRELGIEAERIQTVLLAKPALPWWRRLFGSRHA
jgi:hypothetical protein